MNQEAGTPSASPAPPSQTPAEPESLAQALSNVFEDDKSNDAYGTALVRLTAGLTLAGEVALIRVRAGGEDVEPQTQVLARTGGSAEALPRELRQAALELDARTDGEGCVTQEAIAVSVALPNGTDAALVAQHPSGGRGAIALAYERMALVSAAARYRFADPDSDALAQVLKEARALAQGGQTNPDRFLKLAKTHMGADAAILGWVEDGRIVDIAVAGAPTLAARADARPELQATLTEALAQPITDAYPLGPAHGAPYAVLYVPNAQGGAAEIQPIADTFAAVGQRAKTRFWTRRKLIRAGVALALIGAGFVPLPTTVSLPADVTSTNLRVLTAPVAGVLEEAFVEHAQTVEPGAPLARFDAKQVELTLVQSQAEYADALARRDSARASRNAADVALQEIELERITAQIARLEDQRDSARLTAPLGGVVVAPELEARVGSFYFLGAEVMRVADPEALRLDVQIPQTEIAKVETGAFARFHPDFDPSLRFETVLGSISPASDPDMPNVRFAAKASFDSVPEELRLGMRGVLRIDGPARSVWERVGRAAYRAYRTFVWA
ncbi:MAG: efflux RND transporter periplasmic adaptor subunit [Pseudomonadota bacterium]